MSCTITHSLYVVHAVHADGKITVHKRIQKVHFLHFDIYVALCTLHIDIMLRCARVGRGGVGWPKNVHSPAITHAIL